MKIIKSSIGVLVSALVGASAGRYFDQQQWFIPLAWAAGAVVLWLAGVGLWRLSMSKGSRIRAAAKLLREQAEEDRIRRDPATYGMPPGLPPIGDGGAYMYGNGKAIVADNSFATGGRLTAINNDEVVVQRNTFGHDKPAS